MAAGIGAELIELYVQYLQRFFVAAGTGVELIKLYMQFVVQFLVQFVVNHLRHLPDQCSKAGVNGPGLPPPGMGRSPIRSFSRTSVRRVRPRSLS